MYIDHSEIREGKVEQLKPATFVNVTLLQYFFLRFYDNFIFFCL